MYTENVQAYKISFSTDFRSASSGQMDVECFHWKIPHSNAARQPLRGEEAEAIAAPAAVRPVELRENLFDVYGLWWLCWLSVHQLFQACSTHPFLEVVLKLLPLEIPGMLFCIQTHVHACHLHVTEEASKAQRSEHAKGHQLSHSDEGLNADLPK